MHVATNVYFKIFYYVSQMLKTFLSEENSNLSTDLKIFDSAYY